LFQGLLDGGLVAQRDLLVRRPLAPLHAVDFAEVVFALTERVGQPLGVFVGVLVPDLAAQRAEFSRRCSRHAESPHLADGRFEGQLARGDRREAFLRSKRSIAPGKLMVFMPVRLACLVPFLMTCATSSRYCFMSYLCP
jgi:hypothetical protein